MIMKIILIFRPNTYKIIMMIVLTLLSLLVVTNRKATSKVTWEENRGLPLPYIVLVEYRGPCPPQNFCKDISIKKIIPVNVVVNLIGWYLILCVIYSRYRWILRHAVVFARNRHTNHTEDKSTGAS